MRIHKAATLDQLLHGGPVPRVAGVMVFDHKTGGTMQTVSQGQYQAMSAATNRKGRSSILRQYAPAGGRLQ